MDRSKHAQITIKIETYEKLKKIKVKLIRSRIDPDCSFDDVLNHLIDSIKQ